MSRRKNHWLHDPRRVSLSTFLLKKSGIIPLSFPCLTVNALELADGDDVSNKEGDALAA